MRERKKIVTAKSIGMVVASKDHVPSLDSSLQEMKEWTRSKVLELYDQIISFKEQVAYLCQNNEYRLWIQTTAQKDLSLEWGVSQPTVSRLVGDIQKEYKNDLKQRVIELFEKGENLKKIQAEIPLTVDERTLRRWVSGGNEANNDIIIDAEVTNEESRDSILLEKQLKEETRKREEAEVKITKLQKEVKKWKKKYQDLRTKYSSE